jgi:hypothetical protein
MSRYGQILIPIMILIITNGTWFITLLKKEIKRSMSRNFWENVLIDFSNNSY